MRHRLNFMKIIKKSKLIIFFILTMACGALAGCTSSYSKECSLSFEAMDTYMTVTVYGKEADEAAAAVMAELERLDGILSAEDPESEVYALNENGGWSLSEDTAYLVENSLALYEATGGAFDITIYPVARLWGFVGGEYAVPDEDELADALSYVGSDMLDYESGSGTLSMKDGMAIGLGAIAKGYSGDRILALLADYDVTGAVASLGGNIAVYGKKTDGSAWNIAIQDPEDSSSYICVVSLEGGVSVVTSGGYERYFEEDGVTYHHILDPETGYPASSGLISVSVISENGTAADALATAFFVMGMDEAVSFWKTNEDYDFEMILVDEDGNIYITEGLADSYSSDYETEIISR